MNYASPEYWERRYTADPTPFEFICSFVDVKNIILSQLQTPDERVLVLGTGMSLLAEDMAKLGCSSITAVDMSHCAINTMNARPLHGVEKPDYRVADIQALPFADGTFALAIDKGTIDAILTRQPSDVAFAVATKALRSVRRALQPGGRVVVVSVAPPEDRAELFHAAGIPDVVAVPIPKQGRLATPPAGPVSDLTHFFVYIATIPLNSTELDG